MDSIAQGLPPFLHRRLGLLRVRAELHKSSRGDSIESQIELQVSAVQL